MTTLRTVGEHFAGSVPPFALLPESFRQLPAQKPSDLWGLEHHLNERRKEIDHKYDFRSSRLVDVLGRLFCENRVGDGDLRGLSEEKLNSIRSFAQFSDNRRLDPTLGATLALDLRPLDKSMSVIA